MKNMLIIPKAGCIILLVLLVFAVSACAATTEKQDPKTKKVTIPDQREQITPEPPSQPPANGVIEEIDAYEAEDLDIGEFDKYLKEFEGL